MEWTIPVWRIWLRKYRNWLKKTRIWRNKTTRSPSIFKNQGSITKEFAKPKASRKRKQVTVKQLSPECSHKLTLSSSRASIRLMLTKQGYSSQIFRYTNSRSKWRSWKKSYVGSSRMLAKQELTTKSFPWNKYKTCTNMRSCNRAWATSSWKTITASHVHFPTTTAVQKPSMVHS